MTMSKKNQELNQLVNLLSAQNAEQHAGLLDMGVRLAIYQAFAGPLPDQNVSDVVKELNLLKDKPATMMQFIAQARTIATRLIEQSKVPTKSLEVESVVQPHSPYSARAADSAIQPFGIDMDSGPVYSVPPLDDELPEDY